MSASTTGKESEPPSRAILRKARRVCIKAGTSVVANEDGRPSLTRLGAIAEQIAELNNRGIEVIFVSSGAVGMGKRLLRKQRQQLMSFKEIQSTDGHDSSNNHLSYQLDDGRNKSFLSLLDLNARPHTMAEKKKFYDSACAAAGQFEMMNLYCSMFAQCDVSASQILVTQGDFVDAKRLENLKYSVERLLDHGIVPILNENDAVSANLGYTADDVFSDNDSLAGLCARSFGAEVLVLLTDVEGVYDRPPSEPKAKLLSFFHPESSEVEIGAKSQQGERLFMSHGLVRFVLGCFMCTKATRFN
jgi:delta-1-pyrroline-5-carboxylate synthetase